MLLKTNAERQAMILKLALAIVGMGLLVFTWVRILQWAAAE
jgi:hypothetical protein